MEYYGITMEGDLKVKSDTSLPSWTASDEAKLIYDSVLKELYIGGDSDWVHVLSATGGSLSGQLSTTESNYGSYFKNITISDSTASGGINGDIWLQYL